MTLGDLTAQLGSVQAQLGSRQDTSTPTTGGDGVGLIQVEDSSEWGANLTPPMRLGD